MPKNLEFGIQTNGIKHSHGDLMPDIDTRFQMVKKTCLFDYVDKTPAVDEVEQFLLASKKYNLPVRCGGWFYMLGRDKNLLIKNLQLAKTLGSSVHNIQLFSHNVSGEVISDRDVANFYAFALEEGDKLNVYPCLEVHVNMWSEDFLRVDTVGNLVESMGLPFQITLDHSHIIFKIDNPIEQEIFCINDDIKKGNLILDPFTPGHICGNWITRGWVRHCHARSAIPNNPKNIGAADENGNNGRGIQYPFCDPGLDNYHEPWNEKLLEPWKEVVRQLMYYHANNDDSQLGQISTEFISNFDYGEGCKYSLFEQAKACTSWMRTTWKEILENAPD